MQVPLWVPAAAVYYGKKVTSQDLELAKKIFTLVFSSLVLLPKCNIAHTSPLVGWPKTEILRNCIHWIYYAIVQSTGLGLTFLHQVWPAEKDSIFKGRVGLLGEWTQIWQWADNRWLNSINQCNYALDKWDNAFLHGAFLSKFGYWI